MKVNNYILKMMHCKYRDLIATHFSRSIPQNYPIVETPFALLNLMKAKRVFRAKVDYSKSIGRMLDHNPTIRPEDAMGIIDELSYYQEVDEEKL